MEHPGASIKFMNEIRIGEKMSDITDMSDLVTNSFGDIYMNKFMYRIHRPLTTGQLFYVKLRQALDPSIAVEVYWNHFNNLITGVVTGRNPEHWAETTFPEQSMPRPMKVQYIDGLVQQFKESEAQFLE